FYSSYRFFFFPLRLPPSFSLFPYTTLFRSDRGGYRGGGAGVRASERPVLVERLGRLRAVAPARHACRARVHGGVRGPRAGHVRLDRKSTRLNSSHRTISYAVFCLKKKKK